MNSSFAQLIKRVDNVNNSVIPNEVKLKRSGALIYQGSLEILEQIQIIEDTLRYREINQEDTLVDSSFSQFLVSLTQQSVSTLFLQQYLQPQVKPKYKRESTVRIESLTPVEAVNEFDLDLLESEIISLAHDEDIAQWSEIVRDYLGRERKKRVSLVDLVNGTKLNLAKVFLAVLHGDFIVSQQQFYDLSSLIVDT